MQQRRFAIHIEYDGTDFVGWQIQLNGRSVQEEVERALHTLLKIPVRIYGAGRTDAGVHASGQLAHFDSSSTLDPDTMRKGMNAYLPQDITVHDVRIVEADFHARFSASSRAYTYTIAHKRISIDRRRTWILYARLDHDAIQEAARHLPGTHDFTSFSKATQQLGHAFCHVIEASWQHEGDTTHFLIRANRFLHGMVRCIVGGLVLVGKGTLPAETFSALLETPDRKHAPMLAPAHGLELIEVRYDEAEHESISHIIQELKSNLALRHD